MESEIVREEGEKDDRNGSVRGMREREVCVRERERDFSSVLNSVL